MEVSRQGRTTPTLISRARRYFVPLLVVMGLSLCLQVVGLATPGWIVQKYGPVEVHMGLWTVRVCDVDYCESKSIDEIDTKSVVSNGLTEYRVETCLGLASIFVAIVVCAYSRRPGWIQRTAFGVISLSALSGILALIAAGKIADNTRKAHDLWQQLIKQGESPFKFPYSVFLTGLGGIFACIASLVGLCGVRPCTSEPEPSSATQMSASPPQYSTQTVYQPYPGQPYAGQPHLAQSNQAYAYPVNTYPAPHPGYTGQYTSGEYPDITKTTTR